MHPGRVSNATRQLGAPEDWDKTARGPCSTLWIRDEHTNAGHGMTSAWFPTPEELRALLAGAPIHLTIIGHAHPPVALAVGNPPE